MVTIGDEESMRRACVVGKTKPSKLSNILILLLLVMHREHRLLVAVYY